MPLKQKFETETTDPCEAMELVHSGEEVNHQGANR